MIVPAVVSLEAFQNGVLRDKIAIKMNGVPADLTGCSIKMQVRPSIASAEVKAEADTTGPNAQGSEIVIVSPKAGTFEIFLSNLDMQDIATNPTGDEDYAILHWDAVITHPNGDFFPYVRGTLRVHKGVTRED